MLGATIGVASQYFGDPIRYFHTCTNISQWNICQSNICQLCRYLPIKYSPAVSSMVWTRTWPRTTAGSTAARTSPRPTSATSSASSSRNIGAPSRQIFPNQNIVNIRALSRLHRPPSTSGSPSWWCYRLPSSICHTRWPTIVWKQTTFAINANIKCCTRCGSSWREVLLGTLVAMAKHLWVIGIHSHSNRQPLLAGDDQRGVQVWRRGGDGGRRREVRQVLQVHLPPQLLVLCLLCYM